MSLTTSELACLRGPAACCHTCAYTVIFGPMSVRVRGSMHLTQVHLSEVHTRSILTLAHSRAYYTLLASLRPTTALDNGPGSRTAGSGLRRMLSILHTACLFRRIACQGA